MKNMLDSLERPLQQQSEASSDGRSAEMEIFPAHSYSHLIWIFEETKATASYNFPSGISKV